MSDFDEYEMIGTPEGMGMYLLFKDIHQSNFDDVKEQELQAELILKYRFVEDQEIEKESQI